MYALDTARDINAEAAAEAEGHSSEQYVRNLEQERDRLREMSNVTAAQARAVMGTPLDAQAEHLQETADHLDQAVTDVKEATKGGSMTIENLEGDAAGMAYLGEAGTQVLDPLKSQGETSVVDKDFMQGVEVHEREHTLQSKDLGAEAIKITATGVQVVKADQDTKDPSVITKKKFVEVGAMRMQKKVVPKSFEGLHDDYKGWYREILAHGQPDRVQELAREKDGLLKFGAEIAQKKKLSAGSAPKTPAWSARRP